MKNQKLFEFQSRPRMLNMSVKTVQGYKIAKIGSTFAF
jgi:hypothetical protein